MANKRQPIIKFVSTLKPSANPRNLLYANSTLYFANRQIASLPVNPEMREDCILMRQPQKMQKRSTLKRQNSFDLSVEN